MPADKVEVVPLGVDQGRFRPLGVPPTIRARYGLADGKRYLIYVGSEDPRKNLHALMQALAWVRGRLPEVELVKVGRPHFENERARLVDLADRLGVLQAIHFLDDVPEADLPLLYNLADVCVMPSLYEGFGFPVLEAMACGTPVVCSDATSLPELAGDAAILVDCTQRSFSDLAEGIYRALSDESESCTLRAKGLNRVARFTWSARVDRVASRYSRLLASHVDHKPTTDGSVGISPERAGTS